MQTFVQVMETLSEQGDGQRPSGTASATGKQNAAGQPAIIHRQTIIGGQQDTLLEEA
jgi:hypothetical protein